MIKLMTKTALVAATGLVFAATPALAADGNPATATGTGKVRILQPLSIDATEGTLDFGVLVKGTTVAAGSYYDFTLDQSGNFTCDAAWACSADKTVATFTVSGAEDESVQVTIDDTVDLDGDATEDFLVVDLELLGDNDDDNKSDFTLTNGEAEFTVAGTLTVRGDVDTGTYSETFAVSAEYL